MNAETERTMVLLLDYGSHLMPILRVYYMRLFYRAILCAYSTFLFYLIVYFCLRFPIAQAYSRSLF